MAFLRGKRPPRIDPRQLAVDPDLSLDSALERLRAERSGMAFIYSSMDLFVARFRLSDLVLVFHDGHGGTQIFRWGGKPISPDRKSLIHAAPGVYYYPSFDRAEDVDLLFEKCQREFADLRSRGDASTGVISPRPFRERPREEPRRVDEVIDTPRPFRERAREAPRRVDEVFDTSDALVEVEVEVEDPQFEGSQFAVATWRPFVSKVFIYITVANLVLALVNVTGSVRFVLGLILGLAIPGWSIVGLIHFRDTALEIALSMAASFAVVMLGAQVLITIHFWHLEAFEVFLCLICLPSLVYQAKWDRFLAWWDR
jgi:hypothetical protein